MDHGASTLVRQTESVVCGVQIGGCTIHSFAGIGKADSLKSTLAAEAVGNKKTRERWRTTDVLLIDEVSMVDGDVLDKVT